MKLLSFLRGGRSSYGVLEGERVRDAGAVLGAECADLKSVLTAVDGVTRLSDAVGRAPAVPLADVTLLPPIPNPSKIFCIGLNYEDHRIETGRPVSAFPAVFTRFADTQVAHGQDGWIPAESVEVDFEGELAVVIGRRGRRIGRDQALEHVAGYACYNDISVRDWQRHTTQFTPGKNFPRTGGFGPWLVTADEIPDPQSLELTTRINGHVMQQATTAQMIFRVADLIAYLSRFTPLSPGDVILTGTPGGVGVSRTPPVFLTAGDIVEIEISSIGTLRLRMVPEPSPA
jgi:2-keto-4-pentenoate hydratase/2-oxohepta-3-ene-1,7-dioic acid hydratase in catechol pathway